MTNAACTGRAAYGAGAGRGDAQGPHDCLMLFPQGQLCSHIEQV